MSFGTATLKFANQWVSVTVLVVALACLQASAGDECLSRKIEGNGKKLVCVCNEQQCHKLKFEWPEKSGQAVMVQSTKSGRRFKSSPLKDHKRPLIGSSKAYKVRIDLGAKHQQILGWGGSFSDAAGINIGNLSSNVGDKLLQGYFGEDGLQYNFARVPIGGSDFSVRAYSYDDTDEPDYDLKHWALAHEDHQFKIPFIKKAAKLVSDRDGSSLKLIATPWSPPKWMKSNNNFKRGKLINDDKTYKSYAEYLMKFYDAYESHGIRFWGATVQNEPVASNLPIYPFNSVQFSGRDQVKFIAEYLGPALKARNYTKANFKLMVGDDSLGLINIHVPTVLRDKRVLEYVSGLAFHWYTSGTFAPYEALSMLYDSIKDKIEFVIMTEACVGTEPIQRKVDLGSWSRGEIYAKDIIEDLLRHTGAWIDWNLALSQKGGPNWSGNFADSPVIVNGKANEFYKQPMYYALAHFSRFFRPGSVRVGSQVDGTGFFRKKLLSVAVLNPKTNHLIVNILNRSDSDRTVEISIDGRNEFNLTQPLPKISIPEKSINTIVLKL